MPDWNALLRERLKLDDLPPAQQKEITAELASHLDDLCVEFRLQGLMEFEAVQRALNEITDSDHLSKAIRGARRAEGSMNDRTKQLWLPVLQTMAIAIVLPVLLRVLYPFGLAPRFTWHAVILDVPWLLFALMAGGVGAASSRRAGGSRITRIVPAVLSASTYLIVMGLIFLAHFLNPTAFAVEDKPIGFLIMHLLVLPGIMLFLGALPFLFSHQRDDSGVAHA